MDSDSTCSTDKSENGTRVLKGGLIKIEKIEIDQDDPKPDRQVGLKRFLGFGLALLSGLSMSCGNILTKMMINAKYDPLFITFVRFQGMTTLGPACVVYFIKYTRKPIFSSIWPISERSSRINLALLLARSTVGAASIYVFYESMRYLTVADAGVIVYSCAITTVFLARIMLKEPLGIVPILMAILAVIGIFVISKPPILTGAEEFDTDKLIGTGIAVAAMVLLSLVLILSRLMRKINYALLIAFYGYASTLQILVLILVFGLWNIFVLPTNWTEAWIMIGVAVFNMLGQTFSTAALKFENAGPISIFRTCDSLFNFILQFLVLGVAPEASSLIGALIIVFATFTIGFRNWLEILPDNSSMKIRFHLLLK